MKHGLRDGAGFLFEGRPHYGIPFLGDNNFMIDVLREEPDPKPAYWYRRITNELGSMTGRCRLTAWIDRADMTRTVAFLYVPTEGPVSDIPDESWTPIDPPSEISPSAGKGRKRK